MRSTAQPNLDDLIDHDIYNDHINSQQISPTSENLYNQNASIGFPSALASGKDYPLTPDTSNQVQTLFGKLNKKGFSPDEQKKMIDQMVNIAAGAPGLNVIGRGLPLAKEAISPIVDYLQPGKAAEAFRSQLGSGTSTENIAELSKRAQFARQSTEQEALIPKTELYSQEGQSNIFQNPNSESKYLTDPSVTDVYSPKGNLMKLHNEFESNPTLDNYDNLQSALKKELRAMQDRAKISDTAQPKADQLVENIKNLNADKDQFMSTLPENMQNLENEFRNKYKSFAQTYKKGSQETGSSLTLRRLAEGRSDLVDDSDVTNLFSSPTKADKQAMLDMGDSAAKNALYSALQRVKPEDAEGMANTILDLKRTKGFDNIITPEFETWANNMLKQTKYVGYIKKALTSGGGAAVGGAMLGPAGAAIGALAPLGVKYGIKGIQHLKKM